MQYIVRVDNYFMTIFRHSHENIVPITGKCLDGDKVIVLYELMTNGSLRGQLNSRGVLGMDRRVTILRGQSVATQDTMGIIRYWSIEVLCVNKRTSNLKAQSLAFHASILCKI